MKPQKLENNRILLREKLLGWKFFLLTNEWIRVAANGAERQNGITLKNKQNSPKHCEAIEFSSKLCFSCWVFYFSCVVKNNVRKVEGLKLESLNLSTIKSQLGGWAPQVHHFNGSEIIRWTFLLIKQDYGWCKICQIAAEWIKRSHRAHME